MITKKRVVALLFFVVAICGCASYSGEAEEVRFVSSDGVELRGSLVFPRRAAPKVPAVLLLHGAEPATRSLVYRMHANIFLERGMAVLLYDKRGAGESGGDHDVATYAQLIDDALAAIRHLRQRPEIDAEKIGLVGASESGWLTPEIAERAGNLAFIINKVGPAISWRETNAWEIYNDLLAEGVGEEAAREQADVFQRLCEYYITPNPDDRPPLEAELDRWAGREDSALPVELGEVSESYIQDISYDPGPFLERLTTPIFYVYGSEDINVPTEQCVRRLIELQGAGLPVTFHVYEGEGHELGGVGITGYCFVDGYADLLGDFAEQHTR
jgi:pimeloyl-ACP methyl ester carboxylesterase